MSSSCPFTQSGSVPPEHNCKALTAERPSGKLSCKHTPLHACDETCEAECRVMRTITPDSEPLCQPPTDEERAANARALSQLSRVNRFRLMFGQPFLHEP